jgi:uncharacterized peroxidase-related enzyme
VQVSRINSCSYCVAHHAAGLRRALADPARADDWLRALESGELATAFDARQVTALGYADRLTRAPSKIAPGDIDGLREAGWSDGEILEINQVAAYFAYANRTVLGLGVALEPDTRTREHSTPEQ